MPNRHLLIKLWQCQKLCLFCLMRQKHCWNYFAFNQSYLAEGKIAPVVILPYETKWKYLLLHWRIRTGWDWWFSKILRIRTGSDSILSDQDWTRTEKFHSPLISAVQLHPMDWLALRGRDWLGLTIFTARSSFLQWETCSGHCRKICWFISETGSVHSYQSRGLPITE